MRNNFETTSQLTLESKLQSLRTALQDVEREIQQVPLDRIALEEFRLSIDQVRGTIWALLTLISDLNKIAADPDQVVSLLSAERLRRAIELNREISLDIDSTHITIETQRLGELFQEVSRLQQRLERLLETGR